MPRKWTKPYYEINGADGEKVLIDVTSSVSPGLPPNKVVRESIVPLFKKMNVHRIVDFGAGAMRHVFPLLSAGFEVCAVEFKEQFARPVCAESLKEAEKNPNFTKLIWPQDFIEDKRRFDAALLCYVLQTMPVPKERELVLKLLKKKLNDDAYLLLMSRYNQLDSIPRKRRVSDGYYMWPDREYHSFYREFKTEEVHDKMREYKFNHIRSLSERGTDQIFLYSKGDAPWV
jgi:hypothetical protein